MSRRRSQFGTMSPSAPSVERARTIRRDQEPLQVIWVFRPNLGQAVAVRRFVERILTLVQTLRLQRRSAWKFLPQSFHAYRSGQVAAMLIEG
jgi:hypothetical protein